MHLALAWRQMSGWRQVAGWRHVAVLLGLLATTSATQASEMPKACPPPGRAQAVQALAAGRHGAAVHGLAQAGDGTVADKVRLAVALEQTARFDAAGKLWQQLAEATHGETRMRLERRRNALAEAEVGIAAALAGNKKEAVLRLRSAWFDLQAQAVGAAWPGWLERTAADKPGDLGALPPVLPVGWALQRADGIRLPGVADRRPDWLDVVEDGFPLLAGRLRWGMDRVLGDAEDEAAVTAVVLAQGDTVVVGRVFIGGAVRLRAWAIDATGRRKWVVTRGALAAGEPVVAQAAVALKSGLWAVAGVAPEPERAWLALLDARGRLQAETLLAGRSVAALHALADGTLLAAGSDADGKTTFWHVDAGLRTLWQQSVPALILPTAPVAARITAKRNSFRFESRDWGQATLMWQAKTWRLGAVKAAKADAAGLALPPPPGWPHLAVPLAKQRWLLLGETLGDGCARDVTVVLASGKQP